MSRKLNKQEQIDEALHALKSVVDGMKNTLLYSNKLYDADHNAYYAMWYWIEWGNRVHNSMMKETGGDN